VILGRKPGTSMKLIDYPAEIAEKQRQLLRIEQHIRRLQEIVNGLTAEIDTAIAFDSDLKNDAQRKAKRLELMSAAEYRKAVANLLMAQDERAEIEIDTNLLRNQFSVLKLQLREAIAGRELQMLDAA
jgi:vacuolar-type H+-ATPase subunit D/Vma8